MTKVLFLNPSKWGRGITFIWIPSHAGVLKKNNHEVELFDASFYNRGSTKIYWFIRSSISSGSIGIFFIRFIFSFSPITILSSNLIPKFSFLI